MNPETKAEIFLQEKNTAPNALTSSKTVLSVRDQGLEPWTP